MRLRSLAALALAFLLGLPGLAAAAGRPAPGRLRLHVGPVIRAAGADLALTGQRVRIRGEVAPYVAGQRVPVRIRQGSRVRMRRLAVRPSPTGRTGRFSVLVSSPRPGRLGVRIGHRGTRAQKRFVGAPVQILVYSGALGPGSHGPLVSVLQRQLAAEGYAVPRSGSFEPATGRAVLAFRKVNGMARTTFAPRSILGALLRGRGAFRARYPRHGRHIEADLSRQVMAELEGGRVVRVYVVSSGKPSTPTVLGSFRFYRKDLGTNQKGMVDASYFYGGYAIHGYAEVPTYPASHGCLRIPVPDARAVHDWIRLGMPIDVYP